MVGMSFQRSTKSNAKAQKKKAIELRATNLDFQAQLDDSAKESKLWSDLL